MSILKGVAFYLARTGMRSRLTELSTRLWEDASDTSQYTSHHGDMIISSHKLKTQNHFSTLTSLQFFLK